MRSYFAGAALAALCLMCACGSRPDVLAEVGGTEITVEDFENAFGMLTPEEQVRVLEPGGRLALLDRLVTKRLLELSLGSEDTTGASFWIALYEEEWLAESWRGAALPVFADTSAVDASGMTRSARLRILLLPDSSSAARCASEWGSEGWTPPAVTSLAPWSSGGSSYRILEGPLFALPPDLAAALLPEEAGRTSVFPLYGAWAVAELGLGDIPPESLPPGTAELFAFESLMREESGITPYSPAIEDLSRSMTLAGDGRYALPEPGPEAAGTILVEWEGGSIDAAEVSLLFREVRPADFLDGITPEMQAVAAPAPGPAGPGVDLWFYLTGLALRRWEAGMGRATGLDPDSAEIALMAGVEHMLRRNVLESLQAPDSSSVMSFYERHRDGLQLPERRSVLLAYVPAEIAGSLGTVDDFDEVSGWAPAGADGSPLPTPLQTPDAFGNLAEAVFAAGEGEVAGPLQSSFEGLSAYFEVVSVVPAGPADPSEIWPLLEAWTGREALLGAYGAYIAELQSHFGVEIDSSAVESVDPWGGTY